MTATVFTSVFAHGGRTSRYGDFTIIHMHNCSFVTTPMECLQMSNWARGRPSSGNAQRDRMSFVEKFETVLARVGSGVATRGSRSILARMVKSMKASSLMLADWQVPRDLNEGVEMKRRPVPAAARVVPAAVPAAANEPAPAVEPAPSSVVPLLPK